jgi:hypothetical protein
MDTGKTDVRQARNLIPPSVLIQRQLHEMKVSMQSLPPIKLAAGANPPPVVSSFSVTRIPGPSGQSSKSM